MAKRKRLTPPNPAYLDTPPLETKSMFASPRSAPLADVARDASSTAALNELSESLARARDEGRMVVDLPLDQIVTDHLVRDRLVVDETEMQTLKTSLRSRGQQTPIEVVQLGDGRYGLISGWRRCRALSEIAEEDRNYEPTVLALLRRPEEASDAYLAMLSPLMALSHEQGRADYVCADVTWADFLPLYQTLAGTDLFEHCGTEADRRGSALAAAAGDSGEGARILALGGAERRAALADFIIATIGSILRIDAHRIAQDQDLIVMGLDSILVMDFVRQMDQAFGIRCALRQVFDTPTPGALADYVDGLIAEKPAGEDAVADRQHGEAPASGHDVGGARVHLCRPELPARSARGFRRTNTAKDVALWQSTTTL